VAKTAQIQLRVTPSEKADLVRQARARGLDLSRFILGSLLPDRRTDFLRLVRSLARTSQPSFVFAEIHDLLASLGRAEFSLVTAVLPHSSLEDVRINQLAAMVETRAAELDVQPPPWTGTVKPLSVPWFATSLLSLRMHLLCNSPPAFRRRNLFVDSTIGARV
jgi:hypothetical protein